MGNSIARYPHMLPGHPERLKAFDYVGPHRYSLCLCTHNRVRHFMVSDRIALTRDQILRAATREAFAIVAYCFMPDHVHLLVEGTEPLSDLRAFMTRAKQYSGFQFKRQFGAPLWQRYGYEHVLRSNESTFAVARYILENPVRAGLVARIEDYPHIGSSLYSVEALVESVYANGNCRSG